MRISDWSSDVCSSDLLGAVVSGGLGKMTIDEASRALNGHLIGARLATLGQRFLLSGGTRPRDLQLPMRHMAALMREPRSEEHTSELQSLMRISYAVSCLTTKQPPATPRTSDHSAGT